MDFNNNLFVKKIVLERNKIDNFDVYPFSIDVIRNLDEIRFNKNVTFVSSDRSVAEVYSDGTVIGKSSGNVIITVTNSSGISENLSLKVKDTKISDLVKLKQNLFNVEARIKAAEVLDIVSEVEIAIIR